MVYNFSQTIKRLLQRRCLLCDCPIRNSTSAATPIASQRLSLPSSSTKLSGSTIQGLCHECYLSLPHSQECCACCALPLSQTHNKQQLCGACLKKTPHFIQTVTAFTYEDEACHLIQQLKRQFDNASSYILSEALSSKIAQNYSPDALSHIDMIIPTPMFWRRNLKRGNNHAQLLANTVSKRLAIPINNKALKRSKYSPPQKGLNARQRRQNIKGAFSVAQDLQQSTIAIVDDVMTTGSTLNEIAYILKRAGAKEVHAWVATRATKTIK